MGLLDEEENTAHLIKLHLSSFVPLEIDAIKAYNNPISDWQVETAQSYLEKWGSHGELLQYKHPKTTGKLMGQLVEVMAILAFQPGGIRAFGLEFDANMPELAWIPAR